MKIYFAGPTVFHPKVAEIDTITKSVCAKLKVTALIPTDTEIRHTGSPKDIAKDIFNANVDHIRNCHAIIANITPFRGACVDDGTSWELGMAFALKKKVYTYSYGLQDTKLIIKEVSGITTPETVPLRDHNQNMIEDFGLPANLMISCATEKHYAAEGVFPENYADFLYRLLDDIQKKQQ